MLKHAVSSTAGLRMYALRQNVSQAHISKCETFQSRFTVFGDVLLNWTFCLLNVMHNNGPTKLTKCGYVQFSDSI